MEKRNANCKFTILQENEIINEYLSGKSMYILGKNYNCDPSTIKNILRAYNIQSRSLSQARINYLGRTLNEDIFEKIDSCDKAYWLGVMYSDGYISKTNQYTNSFGISVNKKDKEWLEKFSNFLGYNGNINDYVSTSGYSKNTEYSRILIGNNKIVSDLEKLGVVEHKTKKINSLPKISDYLMKDFIRGYIDGDGSLRKEYPSIMICGNKEFLIEIGEFFTFKLQAL